MRPRLRTTLGVALGTTALAGLLAGTVPHAPATGPGRPGTCSSSVPYTAGAFGYASFRIPAVITAGHGQLLAFAEGRVNGTSDTGDIDVVLRRSVDGGCTWAPLQVVAEGNGDARDNPAPVYDPATKQVVLVTCFNGGTVNQTQITKGQVTAEQTRRVFVQSSADDGASFTAPREITTAVKPAGWRWYGTTPGHAFVLTVGVRAGRLLVPADHSVSPPAGSSDTGAENKYYGGNDIYSDDHGASWHLGYVDDTTEGTIDPLESTGAQLPDGRLYMNARDSGTAPGTRSDAYSSDGGLTLDAPFAPQDGLVTPGVEASVLQIQGSGDPLLFSAPADPSARAAMSIRVSHDGGVTWPDAVPVSGLPAAYSDLVQLDKQKVGLLYETGRTTAYDTITFTRLDLAALAGPHQH